MFSLIKKSVHYFFFCTPHTLPQHGNKTWHSSTDITLFLYLVFYIVLLFVFLFNRYKIDYKRKKARQHENRDNSLCVSFDLFREKKIFFFYSSDFWLNNLIKISLYCFCHVLLVYSLMTLDVSSFNLFGFFTNNSYFYIIY